MVDAESEWMSAAESMGLTLAASDVLTPEVRGVLVAQMHAFMEAADYEAALEPGWLLVYDDPWNRDATLDFSLCLQHLGELESACRFYSAALLLDATDPYCLYRIGECLQSLGDFKEARAAFEAALDLSREDTAYDEVRQRAEQRLDSLVRAEA